MIKYKRGGTYMNKYAKMIRTQFGKIDTKRDEGLTIPTSINTYRDFSYGDKKWQVLNLYTPKTQKGPFPLIINVHGGGWYYGDKERYQFYCYEMCKRGFAVINFSYRLAPEFHFPAPLEDLSLVLSWMYQNSSFFNLDMKSIFMVGDSAGAHILGNYMNLLNNKKAQEDVGVKVEERFKPRAIALMCGCYNIEDPTIDTSPELLEGLFKKDDDISKYNVLTHMTSSFPPVFMMTSHKDFLKSQTLALHEALINNDIPFTYKYYVGTTTPLFHCFHLNVKMEESHKVMDEMIHYFKSFIYK